MKLLEGEQIDAPLYDFHFRGKVHRQVAEAVESILRHRINNVNFVWDLIYRDLQQ